MQLEFFLKNWSEIRTSNSMKAVWQQIRVGRHPGFEEGTMPIQEENLILKTGFISMAANSNELGIQTSSH